LASRAESLNLEQTVGAQVIQSLTMFEVPATPDNYAIWYEYYSGSNTILNRTIDTILSNKALMDARTLDDLRKSFFASAEERSMIVETSRSVLKTLNEVIGLANRASQDAQDFGTTVHAFAQNALDASVANLRQLIETLVQESQMMAERSEYVRGRMRLSAEKIEDLERNLQDAMREANVDCLTGLANRKAYETTARRLAGAAMNDGDDLSLLLVDIDHFKRVNDTWGHPTGDDVLRHVSGVIRNEVRGGDFASRYGGEEFAVLLPHTGKASAASVAENIRQAIAKAPVALPVVPPIGYITVSIGGASYEIGEPLSEWISRADSALYSAKRGGRNCVRIS
jgi:diguanylate cyclase